MWLPEKSKATDVPGVRFLLGRAGLDPPEVSFPLASHVGLAFWPASQACLLFGAGASWARPDEVVEAEAKTLSSQGARGWEWLPWQPGVLEQAIYLGW